MRRVLVLLLLTLLAAGLPSSGATAGPVGGPALPRVSVVQADGKPLDLSSLKGRVVLLHFWATWCGPCMQELPALEALHRRLAEDGRIMVLAVNVDTAARPTDIAGLWRSGGLTVPLALDPSGAASRALGVRVVPTSFVVDAQGGIRHTVPGVQDWRSEQWVRGLQLLADEKSQP